jgi:hypothetical protein
MIKISSTVSLYLIVSYLCISAATAQNNVDPKTMVQVGGKGFVCQNIDIDGSVLPLKFKEDGTLFGKAFFFGRYYEKRIGVWSNDDFHIHTISTARTDPDELYFSYLSQSADGMILTTNFFINRTTIHASFIEEDKAYSCEMYGFFEVMTIIQELHQEWLVKR